MNNQVYIEQLHKQRKSLIAQLQAVENAIIGFGGSLEDKIDIPRDYPLEGTYEDKIKHILNTPVKDKSAAGISEYIITMENIVHEEDKNKVSSNVTMIASSMYKAGKIHARKEGVKNIYYL